MTSYEKMHAFYSSFIRKGDLIFDVGANIGNRTEVFLALGGKVVVIEPQEACIRMLESKFAGRDVHFVQKAIGANEGMAEMFICNADTISSMSKEWIFSVKGSGRFPGYYWSTVRPVGVTTMDALIRRYGKPTFCKIDVEGYEYEVLQGLSSPIDAISFEFTPEYIQPAIAGIQYLGKLGPYRFNYSLLESMELSLNDWVSGDEISRILLTVQGNELFGDVYAKLEKEEENR